VLIHMILAVMVATFADGSYSRESLT